MDLNRMDRFAKEMSYSALMSLQTFENLKKLQLMSDSELLASGIEEMPLTNTPLEGICPLNPFEDCQLTRYRHHSGYCNNVRRPLWGASHEPMQRLIKPEYADGIGAIRQSTLPNNELPSARSVSRHLLGLSSGTSADCSLMLAQFGQFIYEDLARIGSNRLFRGTLIKVPLDDLLQYLLS